MQGTEGFARLSSNKRDKIFLFISVKISRPWMRITVIHFIRGHKPVIRKRSFLPTDTVQWLRRNYGTVSYILRFIR